MKRRTLLKTAVAVPLVLAGGAAGVSAVARSKEYDLSGLLQELQALNGQRLRSGTAWSVSEVFQHCAQSIRGSMDGYPQHYSSLFKHTAGSAALAVFRAAGSMRHNLTDRIRDLHQRRHLAQSTARHNWRTNSGLIRASRQTTNKSQSNQRNNRILREEAIRSRTSGGLVSVGIQEGSGPRDPEGEGT